MLRAVVVILLALLVTGCEPSTPQEMDILLENKFQYVIDPNTGLCFARYSSEGGYPSIHYNHVPCTDTVMDNLYNPQK